jgi:hypothetical protein
MYVKNYDQKTALLVNRLPKFTDENHVEKSGWLSGVMVLNDGSDIGSPLTLTPNKNSIINLIITFNLDKCTVKKTAIQKTLDGGSRLRLQQLLQ